MVTGNEVQASGYVLLDGNVFEQLQGLWPVFRHQCRLKPELQRGLSVEREGYVLISRRRDVLPAGPVPVDAMFGNYGWPPIIPLEISPLRAAARLCRAAARSENWKMGSAQG
jgi:hypothetical protein